MGSSGIPRSPHSAAQPRLNGRPVGVYHYSRRKRRLTRLKIWFSSVFLIFVLLFIGFLHAPFQPFVGLRNLWVTTAMTTMSHQYLATWFFSDAEIQTIMDNNKAKSLGNSNPTTVSLPALKVDNGIKLIDISQNGFKGYLLEVDNPALVQVAATSYLGERGEKAEDIAKKTGALAVINGGEFDDPKGDGNGGTPLGILISDGHILYKGPGPMYDIIGINRNNVLVLGRYSWNQIQQLDLRDAVTFTPFLVVDGKPAITQGDGGWGIAPRTAIGQTRDGKILMLVIDGRQVGSIGATLKDVQDIMLQYGAYNVGNLDGGASSVLYYNNRIVNHPSSPYGERYIPSFFIVK